MKKLAILFTILAIVFSMCPITALAATSGKTGDCTWSLNGTELTISGSGRMEDILNGADDGQWYSSPWPKTIRSVVILPGVTYIGANSFWRCNQLTRVTLPEGLTEIGTAAFEDCTALTDITLPASVNTIGDYAFLDCKGLKNFVIPAGVKRIGGGAFDRCTGLTEIAIPASVVILGSEAFYYCVNLSNITIADSAVFIGAAAFNETAYMKDEKNWENDVLYIGKHLIAAKKTISGAYAVKPGTITLASGAFSGCKGLTEITLPESLTELASWTFSECSGLKSVVIPSGVTHLRASLFRSCTELAQASLPEGLLNIGVQAFQFCSLTQVTIPKTVTLIELDAFSYCDELTEIIIPDSVKTIERYAFRGCPKLAHVVFPSGVMSIGSDALSQTAYYDDPANWENGILYVGNQLITAKDPYKDSTITIRPGTKSIAELAFAHCDKVKTVTVPEGVVCMGDRVFFMCNVLESITLPASMTKIGGDAFGDCPKFKTVYYEGTKKDRAAMQIDNTYKNNGDLLEAVWIYKDCGRIGDVNGDSKVNAADALQVLKAAVKKAKIPAKKIPAADANNDGVVNAADALAILKYAVGRIKCFPV